MSGTQKKAKKVFLIFISTCNYAISYISKIHKNTFRGALSFWEGFVILIPISNLIFMKNFEWDVKKH